MESATFVPPDFVVPSSLETPLFRLEPLGPQHNEADYAAWTSSIEHIRGTPGYPDGNWPDGRSIDDNLRDLRRHADDFSQRRGFTYTVLDPATARRHRLRLHLPRQGRPASGRRAVLGAREPSRARRPVVACRQRLARDRVAVRGA